MLTLLAVAARILANPISNVFQKQLAERSAHPLFIVAATHGLLTALALPFLVRTPLATLGGAFWTNMVISAALAVVGNMMLVYALRSSDLSVLGPINAYKAVLGLMLGVVLIGEIPTVFGTLGVALIVAGSFFVIDRAPGQAHGSAIRQFVSEFGVQMRLGALVCSATEAVFLKRALLLSSPLTTFLLWAILGFPMAALAAGMLLRGGVTAETARLGREWRRYLWLTVSTGVMQLTTLLTFGALQVGYSLALFQLSTLVTVYLGHRYFRERDIGRRLLGAVIMVAGAMLIVALGRR